MAGTADNRQDPVYTFVIDTPGNRRGVYSMNPEDPSTLPAHVEPALASMIPEKSEFTRFSPVSSSFQFLFFFSRVSCINMK